MWQRRQPYTKNKSAHDFSRQDCHLLAFVCNGWLEAQILHINRNNILFCFFVSKRVSICADKAYLSFNRSCFESKTYLTFCMAAMTDAE